LKRRVKTHTANTQGSSAPVPWRWRSRGENRASDRPKQAFSKVGHVLPSGPAPPAVLSGCAVWRCPGITCWGSLTSGRSSASRDGLGRHRPRPSRGTAWDGGSLLRLEHVVADTNRRCIVGPGCRLSGAGLKPPHAVLKYSNVAISPGLGGLKPGCQMATSRSLNFPSLSGWGGLTRTQISPGLRARPD